MMKDNGSIRFQDLAQSGPSLGFPCCVNIDGRAVGETGSRRRGADFLPCQSIDQRRFADFRASKDGNEKTIRQAFFPSGQQLDVMVNCGCLISCGPAKQMLGLFNRSSQVVGSDYRVCPCSCHDA